MPSNSALFPRNFRKDYPVAVRGEGCWIIDKTHRRFLDASGQAAVTSIGHGVAEIGQAMAEQSAKIAFAACTGKVSRKQVCPSQSCSSRLPS